MKATSADEPRSISIRGLYTPGCLLDKAPKFQSELVLCEPDGTEPP